MFWCSHLENGSTAKEHDLKSQFKLIFIVIEKKLELLIIQVSYFIKILKMTPPKISPFYEKK